MASTNFPRNNDYKYLFKLLIIGDNGVGKSAILSRFVDDIFTECYLSTIGVDFKIKTIKHDNDIIKLQVWDSAGQERFKSITQSYYRGAHGIITVYDITNANTFENIRKWLEQIDRHADEKCKRLLVGTKTDLKDKREVSFEHGKAFAEEMGMQFVETSAKINEGILKTFETMAIEIKKDFTNDQGWHGTKIR